MPHTLRAPAQEITPVSPPSSWVGALDERWPGARRRLAGILLALLVEGGLLLLLLTLGQSNRGKDDLGEALATFSVAPDAPEAPEPAEPKPAEIPEPSRAPTAASPDPVPDPRPLPTSAPSAAPPLLIPLSKGQMANADIARPKPPAPVSRSGPMGPPNTGSPGDSQRVAGSGPNGEPLYAARWYREPYDDELRGYLSTARGPGWALINCRTVPDFRVEDCVLEAEQPSGSNIGPAVLSAAWQFRVRPPRLGGRSMVGEWVRIRIDYRLQPRSASAAGS